MFINDEINWIEMSWEFRNAEEKHFDNLPVGFDDALFRDCMFLFFGV